MTTLNLFPSRIRFTNTDGTLTPEAYRALQILFNRVGGALGDNGVDVFGDITGAGTQDTSLTDTVMQQTAAADMLFEMVGQPTSELQALADVVQPASVLPAVDSGGSVVATGAVNVVPYGYTTAAQADAIVTLLNNIRTALIAVGIMK